MKNYDNAEHPEFESYLLIHASPDTVFQWLKEHYLHPNPTWNATAGRSDAMEKVLIERDEPLVKLGLALYTKYLSDDAALNLFQNGDMTIKKAVLAGPLVRNARPLAAGDEWVFVILEELLHSYNICTDKVERKRFSSVVNLFRKRHGWIHSAHCRHQRTATALGIPNDTIRMLR